MKEIKPNLGGGQTDEFFNPMGGKTIDGHLVEGVEGVTPICLCGFELIKADEDVWQCIGGSKHSYRMSEGEVVYDKFGQPIIKIPSDNEKD